MWARFRNRSFRMQEALDEFIKNKKPNTQRSYRRIWLDWVMILGSREPEGAQELDARKFWNWAQAQRVRTATVNRKMTILNGIYDFLVACDITKKNPFVRLMYELPYEPTGMVRPTALVQRELVMPLIKAPDISTASGLRDRAILALSFGGGLRPHEIRDANVGDLVVRDKQPIIFLYNTKARRMYDHEIPDWAARFILVYQRQRRLEGASDDDALFVRYRPYGGAIMARVSPSFLQRSFKVYAERIGYKGRLHPHAGRKTAITNLLERGLNPKAVQRFSRHASLRTLETYDGRDFAGEDSPAKKNCYE